MPELYLHHSEVPNILRQLGWTTTLRQVQESHSPQVLRPSVQRRLQSTRLLTSWLDQQVRWLISCLYGALERVVC